MVEADRGFCQVKEKELLWYSPVGVGPVLGITQETFYGAATTRHFSKPLTFNDMRPAPMLRGSCAWSTRQNYFNFSLDRTRGVVLSYHRFTAFGPCRASFPRVYFKPCHIINRMAVSQP